MEQADAEKLRKNKIHFLEFGKILPQLTNLMLHRQLAAEAFNNLGSMAEKENAAGIIDYCEKQIKILLLL